jgi:hypothetical protein
MNNQASFSVILDHPVGSVWDTVRDFNSYPLSRRGLGGAVRRVLAVAVPACIVLVAGRVRTA